MQQCFHDFFLTQGQTEGILLKELESKPAWFHMPLGEAGVGAGQTYIDRSVCLWGDPWVG